MRVLSRRTRILFHLSDRSEVFVPCCCCCRGMELFSCLALSGRYTNSNQGTSLTTHSLALRPLLFLFLQSQPPTFPPAPFLEITNAPAPLCSQHGLHRGRRCSASLLLLLQKHSRDERRRRRDGCWFGKRLDWHPERGGGRSEDRGFGYGPGIGTTVVSRTTRLFRVHLPNLIQPSNLLPRPRPSGGGDVGTQAIYSAMSFLGFVGNLWTHESGEVRFGRVGVGPHSMDVPAAQSVFGEPSSGPIS